MYHSFQLLFSKKTIIFVLIIFSLTIANVFADVVHLFSGKIIEGEVVLQNDELIKVDTGIGISVTYYLDEIDTINGESVTPVKEEQTKIIKKPEIIEEPKVVEAPEVQEPIKTAEPTKTVEPSRVIEKVEKEEAAVEVVPEKDVATLEGINLFKEQASPAAIKPKEAPSTKTRDDVKGKEQSLMAGMDKELSVPKADTTKTVQKEAPTNIVFQKVEEYIKSQIRGFESTRAYFRQKLPFIKERLYAIPVRVRRDSLVFMSAFMAVIYIFVCFPFMQIAKKLGKKHSWLIWIPFVQIFYFIHMASKPLWWTVLFLVPILNVFLPLFLFIDILKSLGKSFWLIILIIIPGVNIFTFWYLAISKTTAAPK